MQMASSAKSRYGALRSASLKTATTSIPRSRQARITRKAISPRLATRMRWNMRRRSACRVHLEEHLPVFDRLLVLHQDLGDDAAAIGGDLVEDFHRLDDTDDGVVGHARADTDERLGVGTGCAVKSAGSG